jgi:hypothetical protein
VLPANVYAVAINPQSPAMIYAGGDGGLARSTDGGEHWTMLPPGPGRVRVLALDPQDPNTVYAGGDGGLFAISLEEVVRDLEFDRTNVVVGSSYSVNVSGSNLTAETFFDVRFTSPGSIESAVALNWQKGPAANHALPAGIAAGDWRINGVRAHELETDHTGNFFPVSATITVVQLP